jgi:UDP-N-acetylglucosamine--N-acetylmuramyl-(pentapeptide) pyrophosphoryl-undecaprenol N-acetylglucosamine transferase
MANARKILLAGGGTAGHLMPAINIALAIKNIDESTRFMFVGKKNGMEREIVEKSGFEIKEIEIIGMKRNLKGIINFALKWRAGYKQSMAVLNDFDPDVVIGTGGYLSAPVLRAANKLDKKIYIQEQNSLPGLATRSSAKFAEKIFIVYESASNYLPADKCVLIGNPIRTDLFNLNIQDSRKQFGLNPDKNTMLILGGSLGAAGVNNAVMKLVVEKNIPEDWQILWQTGKSNFDLVQDNLPDDCLNVVAVPFIHDMPAAYASADLVISRAGAMALSEITAVGLPSILIPYPHATGDHQTINAKSLKSDNAAILISESETDSKLINAVLDLINDKDKRDEISQNAKKIGKPNAANKIARIILDDTK